jgi:hypothetical protein
MRITKPLICEGMLQIAGKVGCVKCAMLNSYQSFLLENLQPGQISALCHHHGWAEAAAANGKSTAETFLRLLEHLESPVSANREMLECLEKHIALCLCHADKLTLIAMCRQSRALVTVAASRERTKPGRQRLLAGQDEQARAGGGMLGSAAAWLFGDRGMPGNGGKC